MRRYPMLLLFSLYLSQGLPFGFQATALPVYLRTHGHSLETIGFATALSLPWLLKAFWSPLIDRFWSARVGRRKSWILPLQALMVAAIFCASLLPPEKGIAPLLILVFLMNLCAATQDIAVDGLAVDILGSRELGPGNAAQVTGYKAGMILGGGVLVWMSSFTGWDGLFAVMAFIALVPLALLIPLRERELTLSIPIEEPPSFREIARRIIAAFSLPGAGRLILFVGSYKTGETLIDAMFKPFLVDIGFTAPQIGLWLGTYGMIASLLGSLTGGLAAARLSLTRALLLACAMRMLPLCGEWALPYTTPNDAMVIALTLAEHFFGGALTTVMFALMMSRTDRAIGSTHYTILASVEVLGKSPSNFFSGVLAARLGYGPLFGIGVALSLVVMAIIPMLERTQPPAAQAR